MILEKGFTLKNNSKLEGAELATAYYRFLNIVNEIKEIGGVNFTVEEDNFKYEQKES